MHANLGKKPLTHSVDNVHLSIFGLNFAIWFSYVTLKIKSRSPKLFCHVHILDSCKFGQNPLTHSEDSVNLSDFSTKLSSFFYCDLEN